MRSLFFGIMVSANNVPLKSILTVSTDITENCPASANTSGYTIVNSIRSVAQTFGSVKLFKAYLGVTEQVPVSRALVLRSELQSSGVSLTDCPHNGRKDVADKMIIGVFASLQHTIFTISQLSVDMLAYAIDNPAPSTVVLISGDRDFAYALAMLRLRRYRVVLITLSNAHPSLRAQASLCFDWISDILEAIDPSRRPTSPRRKKTSSAPAHDKLYLETRSHKTHNPSRFAFQQSYDEDSNIEFMNYFQDAKRRKEVFQTSQKHGAPDDLLPPNLDQSKKQPIVSSAVTSALRNEPKTPARATDTSSCPLYLNGNMQIPLTTTTYDLNSSQIPTPNASVGSTPKLPTHGNIPSRFSSPSTLRGSASLPNLAQDKVARELEPVSFRSTIRIPTPEPDLGAFSSFKQGTYSSINTKSQSLSGVDHNVVKEDDRPDSPALSDISPLPTTTLSTSPPSFMLPQPLSYSLESTVAPSPLKTANPLQPAPHPTVPDKFSILVQCLKSHRSRGSRRPLRSQIGLEINQNGTTYRQAGVLKFSEYVEMAEKAGFVELGGSGGTAWVALRALGHDAPIS